MTKKIPQNSSAQFRLEALSMPEPNSGCWIWMRTINTAGYAHLTYLGKSHRGHRLSWKIYKGQIPIGMYVLHHCDNRACINPDHLFLGTAADNMVDMIKKNRQRHDRGELASRAILTEQDVLEIRASTLSMKELVRKYGVHRNTIDAVRLRQSWKYLAG